MVMTEACEATAGVHDRILSPDAREQWLEGLSEEALALCTPYEAEIAIDRTDAPWGRRKSELF